MGRSSVHRYARICGILALLTAQSRPVAADTVVIEALRDNTLYRNTLGAISNGAGDFFFAGRTQGAGIRRGLILFDIAGSVPEGATIDDVTMTLHASRTRVGARNFILRRVLADWGEGDSNAPGPEGQGGPAMPGDATWLHTFFDQSFWAKPGGDFVATPSAAQSVAFAGFYSWNGALLISDAQLMLDDPASNFGWMLRGPENQRSAKRFDSRESPNAIFRPVLTIEFTPAPLDTIPPEIGVTLNRTMLWPPNHTMVDIVAAVTVVDDTDPVPTFVLTSVTSDEPDYGGRFGRTKDDIQGTHPGKPDTEFELRAERVALGPGRTYTIIYTARDVAGNTAEATVFVRVPHDQSSGGPMQTNDALDNPGQRIDSRTNIGALSVFPNPFNPSTTIGFELGSRRHVVATIYDVRGALIRELVNESVPPGVRQVIWNGRDERGHPAATGVYLLHIRAGGESIVRKLVLVK